MVKSLPGCIVDFRSFTSGIRFLISILLLLLVTVIGSARTVEHTVARGENLQRIAAQYGVSEEDILRANGADRLYTGLKLTFEAPDLPPAQAYGYEDTDGNSNSTKKSKKGMDPLELYGKILDLEEEASIAFDAKKYDKAVKCYDRLIKLESDNPSYYYNRGVSQYNRQKFRQAAEDIEKALGFPEASDFVKENGPDLLADAKARHAAWQERQSQMWAGIIGGALAVAGTTAAVVLTEKESKKQKEVSRSVAKSKSNTASTLGSYSTGFVGFDKNVYNMLMEKTFYDVAQEKQKVISDYRQQCLAQGYVPSDSECEEAYQYYMYIRYGGSSGSVSSSDEEKTSTTNNTNDELDEKKNCPLCHGTGNCQACGGTKVARGMGQTYHCNVCDDHGNCPKCGGSGKVPDNDAIRYNSNNRIKGL